MSTTPTPIPPTIQQSQEELRAAAIQASAPPPAAPPEAQPVIPVAAPPAAPEWGKMTKNTDGTYVIETKYGEKFTGSADDVLAKLAEAKVKTREHYEAEAAKLAPPAPPQPPQQAAEDPAEKAAREYILNSIAKEVGLSSADELKQRLTLMNTTTEDIRSQSLAASFLAAEPTFPNTPEAAAKLGEVMDKMGLQSTVEHMQLAHSFAIAHGMYQPAVQQTQAPLQQRIAPPTLSTSAPGAPTTQLNPWDKNTTLEQLRAAAEAASRR